MLFSPAAIVFTSFTEPIESDDTLSGAPLSLGTKSFRVLKSVVEQCAIRNASYQRALELCESHCLKKIVRVEVINRTDRQSKLETVYFPVPRDFLKGMLKLLFIRTLH